MGGRGRRGRLTFNRRVILVDKVALDQLDGQTRLSDTTATDYDQLVFSEKLRRVSGLGAWHGRRGRRTFEAIVRDKEDSRTRSAASGKGYGYIEIEYSSGSSSSSSSRCEAELSHGQRGGGWRGGSKERRCSLCLSGEGGQPRARGEASRRVAMRRAEQRARRAWYRRRLSPGFSRW